MAATELPIIPFQSQTVWEDWLEANHAESDGIWMKIAKKATGIASIAMAEAIEGALCFGWIDGQRKGFDDQWYLQRFTPRRSRSRWSQINREKVTWLIESGRMRPAGMRAVEAAQADGRWEAAYPSPSKIETPDDLQEALTADPKAAAAFQSLGAGERYSVLIRLHHIKGAAARARRIAEDVADLRRKPPDQ